MYAWHKRTSYGVFNFHLAWYTLFVVSAIHSRLGSWALEILLSLSCLSQRTMGLRICIAVPIFCGLCRSLHRSVGLYPLSQPFLIVILIYSEEMNLHYGMTKLESCCCILQEKCNVHLDWVRLLKGIFCKLFFDLNFEVLVHIQVLWSDSYVTLFSSCWRINGARVKWPFWENI